MKVLMGNQKMRRNLLMEHRKVGEKYEAWNEKEVATVRLENGNEMT